MNAKRGIIVLGLLSAASMPTWAQQIKGVVIDQKSKETLIGAVVTVDGTNVKAITNIDGNFQIDGLNKDKKYTLYINYVGYKTQKIDGVQAKDADQMIALQPDEQQLKEVTVTAVERRNTDAAMIQVAKNSPPLLGTASFAGWTGFDTVSYIGAFDGSNNRMSGWTNFDPQNAKY